MAHAAPSPFRRCRPTVTLLLLCSFAVCSFHTAHAHVELAPGQDKDNWFPWEKLLSAQEMLLAQRDQPSPMWLHTFQALDSLAGAVAGSHTVLFNITTPILPALALIYQPATMLLLTPYAITFGSPHRTMRQLTIQHLTDGASHHFHSVGLFQAATSHTADRRAEDRASLQLMERTLASGAVVLLLQAWNRQRTEWWGDLLLPSGWTVERSWGWQRVESGKGRGGWRPDERWLHFHGDIMTVWQVRVRADAESAEWSETAEAEHRGVSDSRGAWKRTVEDLADAAKQNFTWTPYRRMNRM